MVACKPNPLAIAEVFRDTPAELSRNWTHFFDRLSSSSRRSRPSPSHWRALATEWVSIGAVAVAAAVGGGPAAGPPWGARWDG